MNDATDSRGSPSRGSTVIVFALGAAVGAGLALLLAPDTGTKTRERLASTARRWGKNAGETMENARDAVKDLGTDAKAAVKAGKDSFAKDRVAREGRSERWKSHAADAAPPNSEGRSGEESAR